MAMPRRKWWIDVRPQKVWRGRYFSLWLQLDYEAINFCVYLGWTGFVIRYLMPNRYNLSGLESEASLMWAPNPLVEGGIIFSKTRTIRYAHHCNTLERNIF